MADHDTHDHTGVPGVGTGDIVDPMTTRGDIIIRNASNVTARLGRGTVGQVLTSDGTDIAWAAGGGGSGVTGLAAVQSKCAAGAGSASRAATMDSGVTNGNLLIAFITIIGTQTVSSVASTNTTWTKLDDSGAATAPRIEIWRGVPASSPGATITATYSATTTNGDSLVVVEFPAALGLAGTVSSATKRQAVAHAGDNEALASAPVILPAADEMVVVSLACSNGTRRYTGLAGGPFVIPDPVLLNTNSIRGHQICGYGFPGNVPVTPNAWGGSQSGGSTWSALALAIT